MNSRPNWTKDGIKGEHLERLLESRDEYTAERVFWVPPEARWPNLQNQATRPDIATLIDDAILAVERDNPNLKGKLPRDYARRGIEPVKMKGLIDLIADIGFKGTRGKARDTLGRVYEYFLGKFAAAEGKLGGEFYTPRCVVRVLVEMLEPYDGRIYDPCLRLGRHVRPVGKVRRGPRRQRTDVSIFGQESNPTTWRLAHMNLAIHGIEANLGEQPADTFLRDQHPDLKADFVLANPPFNVTDWSGQLLRGDKRWTFGDPPVGNANYAWIQHFIHHLAYPNGRGGGVAGFVMANGSLVQQHRRRGRHPPQDRRGRPRRLHRRHARAALLHHRHPRLPLVPHPRQDRQEHPQGTPNRPGGRKGETLFIDARKLGTMQTRVLRVLTGIEEAECVPGTGDPLPTSDIGRIVYAYRRWRGEPAPDWWNDKQHGEWAYRDIPGFAKPATIAEIAKHGHVLTPGRYVGAEEHGGRRRAVRREIPAAGGGVGGVFCGGRALDERR